MARQRPLRREDHRRRGGRAGGRGVSGQRRRVLDHGRGVLEQSFDGGERFFQCRFGCDEHGVVKYYGGHGEQAPNVLGR